MKTLRPNNDIISHLSLRDPFLGELINRIGYIEVELNDDYFESLVFSIISQQLSEIVSKIICERVKKLLNYEITAKNIIEISDSSLRSIGISYSKIKYIKNLSGTVLSNDIDFTMIGRMSNAEIIEELTKIKGIGIWTAEMFLIFSLGREDVFSLNDVGLQRSVKLLYNLDDSPTKRQMIELSSKWAPYCTYASLYLWELLNRKII